MYDRDTKVKFIEYLKTTNKYKSCTTVEKMFIASEPMEVNLLKDLAEFNYDEVCEFFKSLSLVSLHALKRRIILYNIYVAWYGKNKHVNLPKFEFSIDKKKEIIREEITWSYIHHTLFNKIVKKYPSKTSAFIVYAIYSGVSGNFLSEISSMKFSDIDIQSHKLSVYSWKGDEREFNREISIDDYFIELAEKVERETEYYDDNGRLLGHLEQSEYLLKRREGSSLDPDKLFKSRYVMVRDKTRVFIRHCKENPSIDIKKLSIESINNSGLIFYIQQMAQLMNLQFTEHVILSTENALIVKRAAVQYGMSVKTVEKIIKEFFKM